MRKRFVAMLLSLTIVASLTACSADDVNAAIEGAASKAGIDIDSNITQEQLDDIKNKAKDSANTVKEIITDDEVQGAAKDFVNSVSDAVKDTKNKE